MQPCRNYACPRAGWCKRISYPFSEEDRKLLAAFYECGDFNSWEYYIRNKAREIYERENPDDAFSNDELEQEKHQNNNRESGMREDDEADNGTQGASYGGYTVNPVGGVQLQRSRYRRSDIPSIEGFIEYLGEAIDHIQERPPVLQNTTRNGLSPSWTILSESYDPTAASEFWNISPTSGIGRAEETERNHILSDDEGGQDSPHH